METFKGYVYKDGKHDFSRAYRETLIFEMLNDFSKKLNDNPLAEEQNLTVAEKRRYRNQIVKIASNRVKGQPDASINDTDVIVDAFFESDFGKKFAHIRDEWEANEKADTVAAVESWTTGQDPDGNLRFTVSPYDPKFANSDLFDDDTDEIGYVVGVTKAGGKIGIPKSAVGAPDKDSPSFFEMSPNKDLFITGVILGKNARVEPVDDAAVAQMNATAEIKNMYGPVSASGYREISHFIKTKDGARDVRNYLLEQTADNPLTEDERKFMSELCTWLSSSGIDFDIKLEDAGDSKSLVASLGRRKNIRLLDRDNPVYQGRIYDDGLIAYMSIDSRVVPGSDDYKQIYGNATYEDRMNAIKWYFGEEATMRNDTHMSGYNDVGIGEKTTIRAKKGSRLYNIGDRLNTVTRTTDSDKTTLVAVGLTDYTYENEKTKVKTTEVLPVMLRIKPQSDSYGKLFPSFGSWTFSNATEANGLAGIMARVTDDTSKFYPEDLNPETGTFTDTVNYDHSSYYSHLYARETLNDWVESAKDYHRSLVNIDDIVECYQNYYSEGGDYEYHFSSDEDIAEIQRLYWDVLVGVKETGKTKLHDDESEFEAFDNGIYKSSIEEKVAAINAHYNDYVENAFGRVPELTMPFATDEENLEIAKKNNGAGFDPGMLAKYMNGENNYSLQRNYDYIRHALLTLGDDYDPSFIKDGSYMASEIKTDMVKYDPSTAVYQHYSSKLKRDTGILYSSIYDPKTGEIDYDTLYEMAPALKDKPFTTEMLMHTADTLQKSGCELSSIEVNIDENGIISYRGAQSTDKKSDAIYNPTIEYPTTPSSKYPFVTFSGTIGQIFEPDENGVIVPNYGGMGDVKKVIVPGYDAYLVANDPDDPKPARDRLRLSGLEQQMRTAISAEIHKAAFSVDSHYNFVPHTTAVNSVYKHMYSSEMTVEAYHDMLDPNKTSYEEVETFKASLDTLRHRCRFPNEYGDGSTTEAQSMLEHPTRQEAKDYDYYYSDLNDNRNMRVLDEEYDGIFCWRMTGGAKTQGLVRYLVDDAKVNPDGTVTSAEYDPANPPVCAIMRDKMMAGTEHDTWDRNLMSSTQILTALRTPRHVGVAMLNLKGDTFDDGFTVSKAFADRYPIEGADGEMRSLIPQDKLADKHGNKGVITRVVDPSQHSKYMMDEIDVYDISSYDNAKVKYRGKEYSFKYDGETRDTNAETVEHMKRQAVKAIQKQLFIDDEICEFFENNPNVDIVASPYSGMSRFNGGTIRDLMNNPGDLNLKGETIEGGMGYADMIVVDMPADVKTHWYDEDTIREGKGRKASGQLLWVLGAKGADKIIDEFYGDNSKAWDNLREYAIATGMDITTDLKPMVGYQEQKERHEHRKLMMMPSDEELQVLNRGKDGEPDSYREVRFNKSGYEINGTDFKNLGISDRYLSELNKSGGFMELPFQLDFKTMSYTHTRGKAKQAGDELFKLAATGHEYTTPDGEKHQTYGMPVLPPSMRSGQDFKDGTARTHDYTKWYLNIAERAVAYQIYEKRHAEISALDVDKMTDEQKKTYHVTDAKSKQEVLEGLESSMEQAKAKAQSYMDKIVSDIVDKQFNTKYNNIREQGMAKKLPSSATAVISAGNNLKSDEVAMSREHAVQLGIMNYDEEKDEYYWANRSLNADGSVKNPGSGNVLIWRDPILRDGAVRYMNVVIDDSVLGIKINPAMGKSFDGDYDGDSYALVALKSKAANAQAFSKFHVSNNLLDLGSKNKDGKYSLYINSGMDVAAIMHEDKTGQIKAKYDALTDKANMLQAAIEQIEAGKMDINDFKFEARVMKKDCGERVTDDNGVFVYDTNDDGSYKTKTFTGKQAINACKMECKNDLDDFVLTAFNDIGTDHIIVKDPETVVKSCQHIVDSGAKGNASKMRSLMDNIGIDYETDEKGNFVPGTAKNITHTVNGEEVPCPKNIRDGERFGKSLFREENKRIQETTAYKADNTQLGGTSSQNGVSAFRDTQHLGKTLELTYPTTQGILQSKHDPQDAKVKDTIVRFWGRDCWDGYKLTGDWNETDPDKINSTEHNRILVVARDENGEPIVATERVDKGDGKFEYVPKKDRDGNPVYETYYEKCTPEEWVKQMAAMERALKVDINEDYLKDLAKQMTTMKKPAMRTSDRTTPIMYFDQMEKKQKPVLHARPVVMGVTEYGEQNGSLLDRVAYTGRMTALVAAAMDNSMNGGEQSLAGNAIQKGVEIIEIKNQARLDGSKESRDAAKKQIEAIEATINNSGRFISKNIIQEAYGDAYRRETGEDQNLIIRKGEEKYVNPVPLGRRDCQVSTDDYAAGTRCMGESDMDYKCRMNSISKTFEDEPEVETAVETPKVATPSASNPFSAMMQTKAPEAAPAVSNEDNAELSAKRAEQAANSLNIPDESAGKDDKDDKNNPKNGGSGDGQSL